MYFYQPDSGSFGDLFLSELSRGKFKRYDSLVTLVAYAKHSGVARIADHLESFRAAKGSIDAVVGINQQQTTIEALELLAQVCTRVRVFYDEDDNKTFHPKFYWLRNAKSGNQWLAVGSNNLTAGGMWSNYELSVVTTARATKAEGKKIARIVNPLIAGAAKAGHLIDINAASIKQLADDGYIISEQEARARSRSQRPAPQPTGVAKKKMFVRSAPTKLPTVPAKYRLPPLLPTGAPPTGGTAPAPPGSGTGAPPTTPPVVAPAVLPAPILVTTPATGFWKRLTGSDVSLTSSPGQIIIPRDYLPFFPALSPPTKKSSGGRQADVFFDVEFREPGSAPQLVEDARLIWYEPAPNHPRHNVDLRFTFRDGKKIIQTLSAGDVLEFFRTGVASPALIISRVPSAAVTRAGDYGTLP